MTKIAASAIGFLYLPPRFAQPISPDNSSDFFSSVMPRLYSIKYKSIYAIPVIMASVAYSAKDACKRGLIDQRLFVTPTWNLYVFLNLP